MHALDLDWDAHEGGLCIRPSFVLTLVTCGCQGWESDASIPWWFPEARTELHPMT